MAAGAHGRCQEEVRPECRVKGQVGAYFGGPGQEESRLPEEMHERGCQTRVCPFDSQGLKGILEKAANVQKLEDFEKTHMPGFLVCGVCNVVALAFRASTCCSILVSW